MTVLKHKCLLYFIFVNRNSVLQLHSTMLNIQMTVYHLWRKMSLTKNSVFTQTPCCKLCASLLEPLTCCVGLNGVEPAMAFVPWKIPDEILPPGKGAHSQPLAHHSKPTVVWNSFYFFPRLQAPTQTKRCIRNAKDSVRVAALGLLKQKHLWGLKKVCVMTKN